jgi:secreted PhoX family phosphatase
MYMMKLSQNNQTGMLKVTQTIPVDTSSVYGAWTMCAGSVSPWNSHLGGEEYEPDARAFELATCLYNSTCGATSWEILDPEGFGASIEFLRFFGLTVTKDTTMDQVRAVFNPYRYGETIEVTPTGNSQYTIKKWFTTGRNAKELVFTMPDAKTSYITDDGERVSLFKFVSDRANDYYSGTLYAAKLTQKTADNGGSFDISWVPLGSANQDELANMAGNLKFSQIFNTANPSNGTCPAGFKSVNVGGKGLQCLSVVTGAEKAAAFFETRRYAAYLGATVEGSKWEGITFSPKRNKMYTAISDIRRGMEDNKNGGKDDTKYDIGGPNHIRLPVNNCGCVYEMDVVNNDIKTMKGLVCGTPVSGDPKNTCKMDGIANPDNVAVSDELNVLLIGEDTGSGHQNDVIWAYSFADGSMTRIFSTPYGSETTSPYFFHNLNGWTYITAVVQHPYGESDLEQADVKVNPYFEGVGAYLGYFVMNAAETNGKNVKFSPLDYAGDQSMRSKVLSSYSHQYC